MDRGECIGEQSMGYYSHEAGVRTYSRNFDAENAILIAPGALSVTESTNEVFVLPLESQAVVVSDGQPMNNE